MYRLLIDEPFGMSRDMPTYVADLDEAVWAKAQSMLTEGELGQRSFSEGDACMAVLRSTALLDVAKGDKDWFEQPRVAHAYLLCTCALNALARLSHQKRPFGPGDHGLVKGVATRPGISFAGCFKSYMAETRTPSRVLALVLAARLLVRTLTGQSGTARPGMAEVWLVSGETELLLAELHAAEHADQASTVRPKGWMGPAGHGVPDEDEGEDDAAARTELLEAQREYAQDVPGLITASGLTYLPAYWFGQPWDVAGGAVQLMVSAIPNIQRFSTLASCAALSQCGERYAAVERGVMRRCAAALESLSQQAACQVEAEAAMKYVESLRQMFPGTEFEPTEAFVRSLRGDLGDGRWSLSCMMTAHMTFCTLMDSDEGSQWNGMSLGTKLLTNDDAPAATLRMPTADELYRVLLRAMAGAGGEDRIICGPPRRPKYVIVSYRLRDAFLALRTALRRVGVEAVLESEASLRAACANAHTNFETGAMPSNPETPENEFVGTLVAIKRLRQRPELNGRVGEVVRWHAESERWEVALAPTQMEAAEAAAAARLARPKMICVKPANLEPCPDDTDLGSFASYVDSTFREDRDPPRRIAEGVGLERLRACHDADSGKPCAICMEPICVEIHPMSSECDVGGDSKGGGTKLPCGHSFHLDCVGPWITREKAECPCCRAPL